MSIKKTFSNIALVFTFITILMSTLELAMGVKEISHLHLLSRFVLSGIGVGSLFIFRWLKHLPSYLVHFIHYIVTLILVFLFVISTVLIEPLSPHAFRDTFLNYTGIYILASIIYSIKVKYDSKNPENPLTQIKG